MDNKDNKGRFVKGNTGKPKGAQAKFTKTVKETVLAVFNDLQDDPKHNLMKFAQDNPVDFYKIASKLIPTEISGNIDANMIWQETKVYDSEQKAD